MDKIKRLTEIKNLKTLNSMKDKIIQISPASKGWKARFKPENPSEKVCFEPVDTWALVEDQHGKRWVCGVIMPKEADCSCLAEDFENFDGYESPK